MVDPISSAGLASSIITFLDLAYKIGKRTREYSELLGKLPPDLQSCRDCIDVLIRSSERLKGRLGITDDSEIYGPESLFESELKLIFQTLAATARKFITLLNELKAAKPFSKAVKVIRNQSRIKELREELDRCILSLLFVLQCHSYDEHSSQILYNAYSPRDGKPY